MRKEGEAQKAGVQNPLSAVMLFAASTDMCGCADKIAAVGGPRLAAAAAARTFVATVAMLRNAVPRDDFVEYLRCCAAELRCAGVSATFQLREPLDEEAVSDARQSE